MGADQDAAFEAVLAYDAAFVPRFGHRFGEHLIGVLQLPARANVLDLVCRTGYPSVPVLDLARDGRVIALDPDPRYLELARARAGVELGRRIFFKQGEPTELRFGDEVFSNVIGNLIDRVTSDRQRVFAEVHRVLQSGGQFVCTLPLRGSYLEVVDFFREVALHFDLARVTERVEQYVATLPTAEMLEQELLGKGFSEVNVEQWSFSMEYASSRDLFDDPVIHAAARAEWRWCAEGSTDPEGVLAHVRHAIDTYFQGRRFKLSMAGGCAAGLKR
ncbi:MAG: methyltransferase domain-containing protein [Myxococcales bacterium]|nr:methyltransferase domain-containing protein [Myxococcales bacterium]